MQPNVTYQSPVAYEYGPEVEKIFFDKNRNLNFPNYKNEGIVQYFDNVPSFPGYYQPGGGFDTKYGSNSVPTVSYLQKPFTDYRLGKEVFEFPRDGELDTPVSQGSSETGSVDTSNYYGNVVAEGKFKGQTLSPDNLDAYLLSEGVKRPMSQRLGGKGLTGILAAISDATAAKMGVNPMELRMQRGLKINPVGANGVVRSVRPRLRPQGLGGLP